MPSPDAFLFNLHGFLSEQVLHHDSQKQALMILKDDLEKLIRVHTVKQKIVAVPIAFPKHNEVMPDKDGWNVDFEDQEPGTPGKNVDFRERVSKENDSKEEKNNSKEKQNEEPIAIDLAVKSSTLNDSLHEARSKDTRSLAEAATILFSRYEAKHPHRQEFQMLSIVMIAFITVAAIVELFVRLVLDPAFKTSYGMQNPASSLLPDFDWQWSYTDKGITGDWSDLDFVSFQCTVSWITSVMLGIGLEFLVGFKLIGMANSITETHEHMWLLAQYLFPFMILVSITMAKEGNAWSFFFGIMGMWKFGFPETLAFTSKALRAASFDIKVVSDALNAVGTLTHHSASMLLITVCTLGLSPLTRPILAGTLPLVVQHMIVGLRYISMPLYGTLEFALEVWFELEAFAVIEIMYAPHGVTPSARSPFTMYHPYLVRALCAMLFAHWLYWIAAILAFVVQAPPKAKPKEDVQTFGERTPERAGTVKQWSKVFRKASEK